MKSNGKLLKKKLETLGISQAELARQQKVSREAVNQWCNTGLPIQRLPSVSRYLGCSIHALRPDFARDLDARR